MVDEELSPNVRTVHTISNGFCCEPIKNGMLDLYRPPGLSGPPHMFPTVIREIKEAVVPEDPDEYDGDGFRLKSFKNRN